MLLAHKLEKVTLHSVAAESRESVTSVFPDFLEQGGGYSVKQIGTPMCVPASDVCDIFVLSMLYMEHSRCC